VRALFAERPEDESVALALLESFDRAGKAAEAEHILATAARDREARAPVEQIAAMGKLGLLGIMVPEEFGGAGADAAQVLAIYQAGLDGGEASFETRAPTWEAFDGSHLPSQHPLPYEPHWGGDGDGRKSDQLHDAVGRCT